MILCVMGYDTRIRAIRIRGLIGVVAGVVAGLRGCVGGVGGYESERGGGGVRGWRKGQASPPL